MEDDFDHDSGRSSPLASVTLAFAKEMVKNQSQNGADFDDVIQYVAGALSVLQQNYNEEEILNSLRMLQSCIKKENGRAESVYRVKSLKEICSPYTYMYLIAKQSTFSKCEWISQKSS